MAARRWLRGRPGGTTLSSIEVHGRRWFLGGLACGCLAGRPGSRAVAADVGRPSLSADEALAALRLGNEEFVNDRQAPPSTGRARRLEIVGGQAPFAVLVGCSDSRVAPELLFGKGLGDLFIVRVAGNSVDRTALGTIEYGVAELGCPLVVVLGHERCGAVQAAIRVVTEDLRLPGAIGEMVAPILPAVLAAQRMAGDVVANAAKENARRVAARLRESDTVLSGPVQAGTVKVVAAYYSLADGRVEFL